MAIQVIQGLGRSATTGSGLLSMLAALYGYARSDLDGYSTPLGFHNDDYLSPIRSLLPSGALWNRDEGTELTKLLRALSYLFNEVGRRAANLLDEADPRLTSDLITDWETAYGIPGECGSLADTIADRRLDVTAKLTASGDPNVPAFESIAEAMGYPDATFETYTPLRAGFLAGAPAYDPDWVFRFDCVRVSQDQDEQLACRVAQLAPVHTYHGQVDAWSIWTQITTPAPAGEWRDTYANDEIWVSVGELAEIQTSENGREWTQRTAGGGTSNDLTCVRYANGLWVAVGQGGEIQTSSDGITWAQRTPAGAYAGYFRGVAYGAGLWCAFGQSGEIQTSPDGVTWTARTAAGGFSSNFWYGIYSDTFSRFILSGAPQIQSSTDGITWQSDTNAITNAWDLDESPDRVICIQTDNHPYETTDGTTWTEIASDLPLAGSDYWAIAYSPLDNVWIIGGNASDVYKWATYNSSDDGVTWAEHKDATISNNVQGIYIAANGEAIADNYDDLYHCYRADLLGLA